DVALGARDALHHTQIVELDYRLRQIKVDRAALHALAIQDFRQVAHPLEFLDKLGIFFARFNQAVEDLEDLRVCHSRGGANDAFVNVIADDLSGVVDFHDAGENQAIEFGAQAANISGQLQGKHGNGTVREID